MTSVFIGVPPWQPETVSHLYTKIENVRLNPVNDEIGSRHALNLTGNSQLTIGWWGQYLFQVPTKIETALPPTHGPDLNFPSAVYDHLTMPRTERKYFK